MNYKVTGKNEENSENVISLYNYIRELSKIRRKLITNIEDHNWYKSICEIKKDTRDIEVYYRDNIHEEKTGDMNEHDVLLKVIRPEFDSCPNPGEELKKWLVKGWDKYDNEGDLLIKADDFIGINKNKEKFEDNQDRITTYKSWLSERERWAEEQIIINNTQKFFDTLYSLYNELQRDSETIELIAANGIIKDKENPSINHPILTKKVNLTFDSKKNEIRIVDTDMESQLYTEIFQVLDAVNVNVLNKHQEILKDNFIHPLDRDEVPKFLKRLMRELSSSSKFYFGDIPSNFSNDSRIAMSDKPYYIVRKRIDGTVKAVEQIIVDIENNGSIPDSINDIVYGGIKNVSKVELDNESIEDQLSSVGGESVDILLSKEANKEQLEIAKRIENYSAVLVQGPPGTGKTHTIANLMGHFLAQGKTVLVTSHTTKALRVLKRQIAPGLQNLCVSVLEDNNKDMERSVDGITNYISLNQTLEVKNKIDTLEIERDQIIKELGEVRRKIFHTIKQETETLTYDGESYTPTELARFVSENKNKLSVIPGKITIGRSFPLSTSEIHGLYKSNASLSYEDEKELSTDLPSPETLLSEEEFKRTISNIFKASQEFNSLVSSSSLEIDNSKGIIRFSKTKTNSYFTINNPIRSDFENLKAYLSEFDELEEWMLVAASDGMKEGFGRNKWGELTSKIKNLVDYSNKHDEISFTRNIKISKEVDLKSQKTLDTLETIKTIFFKKGNVSKLQLMFNKDIAVIMNGVMINNQSINSANDCDLILSYLTLQEKREQCSRYWDELIHKNGSVKFYDLSDDKPEQKAKYWIKKIESSLDWYKKSYSELLNYLDSIGIPSKIIFDDMGPDFDIEFIRDASRIISGELVSVCDIIICNISINEYEMQLSENIKKLKELSRADSKICKKLAIACEEKNEGNYNDAMNELKMISTKTTQYQNRKKLLDKLSATAPDWAIAVNNREGIHGNAMAPKDIDKAWKWSQFSVMINELTKNSFSKMQNESSFLSRKYREITAEYAEHKAWYHLLEKTSGNLDIRQSLNGWKQTVKKIGKGTGKRAPKLRAEARNLMSKSQAAVPAWIMPMNRAIETLNPVKNKFDVLIIDEASQSDLSALAVMYMAEKVIIVGDDKQVSPEGIGVSVDKLNNLREMHIDGKIPNSHLYDASTSIYDIASTTFQPLMLREHFRCVPEIIGYSNMLSYNYAIKPLRDTSNNLITPSIINYRVDDGERVEKINMNEANEIISLIKSCLIQPEYDEKTFGVISLKGTDQVKLIQKLIEKHIKPSDIEKRRILCGTPANFQGDERDVVFLSMIDSPQDEGPNRLERGDNAYKRYNVAASRAKDQLWVVNSLDSSNDLKSGDIRKGLLEYSADPQRQEIRNKEIEFKADSPFEVEVVRTLMDLGFDVEQQRKVGFYKLDLVVKDGKKLIAIECDGERYHSSESQIRSDMERQTILERLGWRFIRIRGSEYYRDKEKTMNRVVDTLTNYEIYPTINSKVEVVVDESELFNRVKRTANVILHEEIIEPDTNENIDIYTIAHALRT